MIWSLNVPRVDKDGDVEWKDNVFYKIVSIWNYFVKYIVFVSFIFSRYFFLFHFVIFFSLTKLVKMIKLLSHSYCSHSSS